MSIRTWIAWLRRFGPGVALTAVGVLVAVPLAIRLTPAHGTIIAGQQISVRATTPVAGLLGGWSGPATLRQVGQTVVPLEPIRIHGPLRPQLVLGPLVHEEGVDKLLSPKQGHQARARAMRAITGAFRSWYLSATLLMFFLALAINAFVCSAWIWTVLTGAGRRHRSRTLARIWHRLAQRIRRSVGAALVLTAAFWLVAGLLAWRDTVDGIREVSSPRDLVGAAPVHLRPQGDPLTGYTAAVIGDSRASRLGGPSVPDPSTSDDACKRSSDSLAAQLTALAPGENVDNLACPGATIAKGLLGAQRRGGHTITPQVSRLLASDELRFVVVMIGPNDLDWTDFLKYCYAFERCDDRVSSGQFAYRLAAFDRNYGDLLAALSTVPGHPQIVVVGSYDVFANDAECADTRGPGSVPGLSRHNLAVVAARNDQLNDVLRAGAAAYGDSFVVPHLKTLCEAPDPQVGPDLQGLSDRYPFHPTGVGMVRLAASVLAALDRDP